MTIAPSFPFLPVPSPSLQPTYTHALAHPHPHLHTQPHPSGANDFIHQDAQLEAGFVPWDVAILAPLGAVTRAGAPTQD